MRRNGTKVDYTSICSPNYLHDSHIRFGLRNDAHVICEKPLVLNPWNIDALETLEKESDKNIYNILQLRLHPAIINLKKKVDSMKNNTKQDFDLTYITSRGNWYYTSWKGNFQKSGGIATNIGVHFFDMLSWIFGNIQENIVNVHTHDRAAGYLEFEKARVRWFLSVNAEILPQEVLKEGKRTYRSMKLQDEEIEFSSGFTDLHTKSYEDILEGKGFRIAEARNSIEIVHQIRNQQPVGLKGEYHPFAKEPLSRHPFSVS